MDGNKFSELKNKILSVLRAHWRRAGIFLLAVAMMAFLLYHTLGADRVLAETVAAVRSVEYEITGLTGYIFRDEQPLYSQNSGAAVYLVEDGARVAVDTELARVYTTGNREEYLTQRRALEGRIHLLEQAVALGRPTVGGMDDTEAALAQAYSAYMAALSREDIEGAAALSDRLFVAMGADSILEGDTALTEELASLRSQLAALNNSFGGSYASLRNETSCYFFYDCDGYESIYDVALLDTLDAAGLRALSAQPATTGSPVGRLVHDYEWYMAMGAGSDICGKLAEGSYYDITLQDGRVLSMYLERIGDGILIFSCGTMPEDFDYGRVQQVELLVDSTAGYRVPEAALYQQKGLDGVYVLSGSEVIFRRVNILYRGDGYVVVAERDYSTENYQEFLNLNDQVIVSLSDGELYDGRILN